MPVGRGYLSYLSAEEEIAYGVDPAGGNEIHARIVTDGVSLEENFSEAPGLGTRAQRGGMIHGQREVGGDVVLEGNYEGGWMLLLKHAMGNYAYAVDTPVAGANRHTFSLAETLPAGLTIELSKGDVDTGEVFLYTGCKVDTFGMSLTTEGVLTFTAGLIARNEAPGQTAKDSTPDYPGELPIKWHYMTTMLVAANDLSSKLRAFDVTINNNLERRYNMDRFTAEPVPGAMREITGNVTVEFDSDAVAAGGSYDDLLNAVTGVLSLVMSSGTLYITGTTPYKFTIGGVTASQITSGSPQVQGPGVMTVQHGFHVLGTDMTVVVDNAQDNSGIADRP